MTKEHCICLARTLFGRSVLESSGRSPQRPKFNTIRFSIIGAVETIAKPSCPVLDEITREHPVAFAESCLVFLHFSLFLATMFIVLFLLTILSSIFYYVNVF